MPDNSKSEKVVCSGGLDSTRNHLELSANSSGSATHLVNYEAGLAGGYRRINGYEKLDSTHPVVDSSFAEGPILFLGYFTIPPTDSKLLMTARKVKKFEYIITPGRVSFEGIDLSGRSLFFYLITDIEVYHVKHNPDGTVKETTLVNKSLYTVNVQGQPDVERVVFNQPFSTDPTDKLLIDPNEYKYYYYGGSSAGWVKFVNPGNENVPDYTSDTLLRFSTKSGNRRVTKVRYTTYNIKGETGIVFVDNVNNPTVYMGTTWRRITTVGQRPDHGVVGRIDLGGPMALSRPSVVDMFEGHLFLGGDQARPNVVAYSAPLDIYNFDSGEGSGQIVSGMNVIQFRSFRDDLYLFGRDSIKKIHVDPDKNFVISQVTKNIGCVARDSIIEIGGDLVFIAPDGIRPVAGTSRIGDVELETISGHIHHHLLDLLDRYDTDTIIACTVKNKAQVRFFFGTDQDSSVERSEGLLASLRGVAQKTKWEFSQLQGIRASACVSEFDNRGRELVIHGDYDGVVYQQERGYNFDGRPISSIYTTPYLDLGDVNLRKMFRDIRVFVNAEGPFSMTLDVRYDWGLPSVPRPSTYSVESKHLTKVYGDKTATYGSPTAIYGGVQLPVYDVQVQGSGYSAQIRFVSESVASHSFVIHGLVIEYSESGRR